MYLAHRCMKCFISAAGADNKLIITCVVKKHHLDHASIFFLILQPINVKKSIYPLSHLFALNTRARHDSAERQDFKQLVTGASPTSQPLVCFRYLSHYAEILRNILSLKYSVQSLVGCVYFDMMCSLVSLTVNTLTLRVLKPV